MEEGLRVCFMGTPEFAVSSLAEITKSKHEIVGVVTAVDKPAGRGRKLKESDVKKFAIRHKLPVYQPTNLKSDEFLKQLEEMNPDVIVVVAFRMLPRDVWSFPKYGTFNLHASLLPKYRGAAPIHWAIINGEIETGVTSFFIDDKIDTGEIILNKKTNIQSKETTGELYARLMHLGANLVIDTLDLIKSKSYEIETTIQKIDNNEILPSAPKLTKENTRINWNTESKKIYDQIRGLNPFPVAWTYLINGEEKLNFKIFKSSYVNQKHNSNPGEIHLEKKKMGVYTKDGIIYIDELKMEGKRKMEITDFLNGVNMSNTAYFK